jgi:hypothetical protein
MKMNLAAISRKGSSVEGVLTRGLGGPKARGYNSINQSQTVEPMAERWQETDTLPGILGHYIGLAEPSSVAKCI